MNKCIKILCNIDEKQKSISADIQKHAKQYEVEGNVQINSGQLIISACGNTENLDFFVDALHRLFAKTSIKIIEIEPFLKNRDYRGVFRIVE